MHIILSLYCTSPLKSILFDCMPYWILFYNHQVIYLTATAHTVNIHLYSYSTFTFMFSVVIPTRKNYGFHLNQSTVMEQQDKPRDFFYFSCDTFFSAMQIRKNAKYNLFESINSTESSGWKLCNILSKYCLGKKKNNNKPKKQTRTHFYYCQII